MQILRNPMDIKTLSALAPKFFGNMIKAVVDIRRDLVALDAELHADLEHLLLEDGSSQQDLWGINLYPDEQGDGFVEFDSMINVRPAQNNSSRGVKSEAVRHDINKIVHKWIIR